MAGPLSLRCACLGRLASPRCGDGPAGLPVPTAGASGWRGEAQGRPAVASLRLPRRGGGRFAPAPFQGLPRGVLSPRVALRSTLGYHPAPLRGLTALGIAALGSRLNRSRLSPLGLGSRTRLAPRGLASRTRLSDSGRGLFKSTVLGLGACPTENFRPNQLWSEVIATTRCGQTIGDFRSVGQTPSLDFSPVDGGSAGRVRCCFVAFGWNDWRRRFAAMDRQDCRSLRRAPPQSGPYAGEQYVSGPAWSRSGFTSPSPDKFAPRRLGRFPGVPRRLVPWRCGARLRCGLHPRC